MPAVVLPPQPPLFISYLRVGKLLYLSLILFFTESWVYWKFLSKAWQGSSVFWILFWCSCFLFSFVHIFLVLADGWSRFQDYRKVKDLFYQHGFQVRIARMYIGSKCQRSAALTAAEELGIKNEVDTYYHSKGVKWHHYVPYFMIQDPLFLFKKRFWSRTFLERAYTPKFNYHQLSSQAPDVLW